jgi:Flp pilus assembly protein TadD
MTKEVMVTAPVLILLFDRAFLAGSFAEAWSQRRGLHLALASTWLILALLMLTTRIGVRGVGYGISHAWHDYLRIEAGAVLLYLRLALFPHPLVFDYGEEVQLPDTLTTVGHAAALAAIAALIVWHWRRRPLLTFLGAAFFILLAPTSSVVPVAGQPIAENRMYLPLAAVAVLVTLGAFHTLGRHATAVVLATALALAGGTIRRNHDYRSELAIWSDTVAKRPTSGRAHSHYAKAVLEAGQPALAREHWQTAIRLSPRLSEAHMNLGSLELQQGHIAEAIAAYEQALQLKPGNAVAQTNLGTALFQGGRREEAVAAYDQALRLRPGHLDARLNLGIVLGHLGRYGDAIRLFEGVLSEYPDHPVARDNLLQLKALRDANARR